MRTPLIFDLVGAYKKTVRLNVLEALLYNFPDQFILYPNNIKSDADYVKQKFQSFVDELKKAVVEYSETSKNLKVNGINGNGKN